MDSYKFDDYIDDCTLDNVGFADIYEENEKLSFYIIMQLRELNATISFAESCTGGLLAATLVGVSGSSDVFNESFVTYANEAKEERLSVPNEVLMTYGAVSEETAKHMAIGVSNAAKSNIGVGITGIAGPTGGTADKPVGLVYIGVTVEGNTHVTKCNFRGDRLSVRLKAVNKALKMICDEIK
jgi:PncC family amidohydrolase